MDARGRSEIEVQDLIAAMVAGMEEALGAVRKPALQPSMPRPVFPAETALPDAPPAKARVGLEAA